jgi:putative SbcD/Mre11-related phosphoesterase
MAVRYLDRALLVEDTLVVADCHVGKSASANLELPVGDGTDMVERFQNLLETHRPTTAVIAGDILHQFDTIPRQVEQTVEAFAHAGAATDTEVVITPGNHDPLIDSIWDGNLSAEFAVGETVFLHGHERPDRGAARYVVGHDHPTIVIEGKRRPCFLYGEGVYQGSDVIMVPSFNRLVRGVRVNEMSASDFRSPLVRSVEAFQPVVRDSDRGETLRFPPLGEFREML